LGIGLCLWEDAPFTGKQMDGETGLYYFNARYYAPELGRFVSVDPIKDGVNWYVYCRNNPLKYVDPSGERPISQDEINRITSLIGNTYYGDPFDISGINITITADTCSNPFFNNNINLTHQSSMYFNLFAHEVFHTIQGQIYGIAGSIAKNLLGVITKIIVGNGPGLDKNGNLEIFSNYDRYNRYDYDIDRVTKLQNLDIEAQADFIMDFFFWHDLYSKGAKEITPGESLLSHLQKYAKVLINSGFYSTTLSEYAYPYTDSMEYY
jgi:RHS repeat-associated protein